MMHCSTEKTHRKGGNLKSPEGDSPHNQQKNGSSGFIKNELLVQKCEVYDNFDKKTERKSSTSLH